MASDNEQEFDVFGSSSDQEPEHSTAEENSSGNEENVEQMQTKLVDEADLRYIASKRNQLVMIYSGKFFCFSCY